jgi:GNAT superfamily N-acetyltransferase
MAGKFEVRNAKPEDLTFSTHLAITNNWQVGPHDLSCAYDFDPSGFFVGELDGAVISNVNMTKYPGHSAFIGSFMCLEEHRGKGYGRKTWNAAWKTLDQTYNIGLEAVSHMVTKYESLGLHAVWDTPAAFLDFKKVLKNLAGSEIPSGMSVVPIKTIDKEKVILYDTFVFGTSRRVLMERWLNIPGSLGWAAVNDNSEVIGFIVSRPTIMSKGTEFARTIAPFFANNYDIAKALLKTAAKECLSNDAIAVSNFEMLFPSGGEAGPQAARLVAEVEAITTPFSSRMYTKGIPQGRQVNKEYSIIHPAFD